jgi:hypothetical protein
MTPIQGSHLKEPNMAGRYLNPCYRQYMPQELLDELRHYSRLTHKPVQELVRIAVRRLIAELRHHAARDEQAE